MLTATHPLHRGPTLVVDATAAASPLAIFFANVNPILTSVATILSIVWFGILIYNWLKDKDPK